MEHEKLDHEKVAIPSETDTAEDGLTEYRVYEHPLLPKRIVKQGLCWPALILGPAYLIYRRLWVPLVLWIVAIGFVRYFAISQYPLYDNIYSDDAITVERICNGALIAGLLILWGITNNLWQDDLETRGYAKVKTLRARSMDEALAIIEREKSANG